MKSYTHSVMLNRKIFLACVLISRRTFSDARLKFHPSKYTNTPLDLSLIDECLFDCDGVLWHGNRVVSKSIDALHLLKNMSIKMKFITNNCVRTREQFVDKFSTFGFNVNIDNIITSGSITAHYLSEQKINHVYMIGNSALRFELEKLNIKVLDNVPTVLDVPQIDDIIHSSLDPGVQAVVVGWDPEFSYRSLAIASLYLQRPGVQFIITNGDSADGTKGKLIPGTGAIAKAIEVASGHPSPVVCGKPSDILIKYLSTSNGNHNTGNSSSDNASSLHRKKLFIGDRLDTDIVFANKAGFLSCLVLSGVTSSEVVTAALEGDDPLVKPTYVMSDLWNLVSRDHFKSS